MSNFSEKEKLFKELYENAIKDVNDGWCYVQDVSMNNYSETTIDSSAVEKVLNPYNGAVEAWKRFLKKSTYSAERDIYSAMYEMHILPAIAVAIAIRVFVCPEVEIILECESSKYSEGEIDYWWAISPIAPNGIALDSKTKHKDYLSRLKKGEAYEDENDCVTEVNCVEGSIADFLISGGVLEEYIGNETSIIIPSTVREIGDSVFEDSDITSVIIPDSVKKIGWSAFENSKIISIVIPDSVKTIEDRAFYGCEDLKSVKLPSGLKVINDGIFYGCSQLSSVELPRGVTIIGEDAFAWCESLSSVELPEMLAEIAACAFEACRNLTSITLYGNLKKIEKYAFGSRLRHCENLSCVIPGSGILSYTGSPLETIFERIHKDFYEDSELEARILSYWLGDCFEIVKDDEKALKNIKSCKKYIVDVCLNYDNSIALSNLISLFQPLKLDEIFELIELANRRKSVKVVEFLNDYRENLYSKEMIEKSESVKAVHTASAKKMTVAELKKIFSFKTEGDTATITAYKGIDLEIVIPEKIGKCTVVAIGSEAFSSFAYGLTETEKQTRESIKSVIIPSSVTSIGRKAFDWCRSLLSITIPNSVTYIGYGAFNGCANLPDVIIPANVTKCYGKAFSACINLKSVSVDEANAEYSSVDGVLFNKNKTNVLCYPAGKVDAEYIIPNSVISIGEYAFFKCSNLSSITIPDGVTCIGEYAFSNCSSLTFITIPDGTTNIDKGVFSSCTSLTSITIPDSVTSIDDFAFSNCTSLNSITIPNSVTSIGVWAFDKCSNFAIHAPAGSYAEQYAKDNNINFIAE